MNFFARVFRHFFLISRHKALVFGYCCYAGVPWRGLMHDWSKYSPTEFWESARYFVGDRSPIVVCREANGFSRAWLHHKGRNPHHYEYWLDYLDAKGRPAPMPFPYALEMICDSIAASRVYNGKEFSYRVLLAWWENRNAIVPVNMHATTKRFADAMYQTMAAEGNCRALRRAREIFDAAQKDSAAK